MAGMPKGARRGRGGGDMAAERGREHVETLVIGGGQAGLSMGYQLSRRDLPYKIVDANPRIGDVWRNRWDSFRLFTPNRLNRLPGMRFPGYRWGFASKDEWADHLESYARKFDLQVETGVRVEKLTRERDRFVAISGDRRFEADNLVVAMSSWQRPRFPDLASDLDRRIVQLHAAEYKNPRQLQEGDVLVVGAGNSGAEIAIEVARTHKVILSGPSTGAIPFRPESVVARVLMPIIGRIVFHRVLTIRTPIGTTDRRNSRTAAPWRLPTSCGVRDSTPGSLGSTSPSSAPKSPCTNEGSSDRSPASTSSVSSSSTPFPANRSRASAATRTTSPRRSPPAVRYDGLVDRWATHQRSETSWRAPQEREARSSTTAPRRRDQQRGVASRDLRSFCVAARRLRGRSRRGRTRLELVTLGRFRAVLHCFGPPRTLVCVVGPESGV